MEGGEQLPAAPEVVKLLSHAGAIAAGDFPGALAELVEVLSAVELPITEIIGSGGGETRFT